MVLWKMQVMHCSETFLQDFRMHSLLLTGQDHGISIKTVDIVLLPPVLHCIQANRLGIHESVKNTLRKEIQMALLRYIFIINISNL